ncbi:MAG: hypothetical protein KC635_30370, partial [Myxococcales bacterium]|nr:hypothetical protein [Myxococcales bacterium]
ASERAADAVADMVVRGESAEPVLDAAVGPAAKGKAPGSAAGAGVQREAKPAAAAAATTTTVSLLVGGSTASVTLPTDGSKKRVTVSPPSVAGLALGALTGKLKKVKAGAAGKLSGTATYRGQTLRVSGSVHGRRVKLYARFDGDAALAPGLRLTKLRLTVGSGVSGSGSARVAVPGVTGTVKLRWEQGELAGSGKGSATLPILGKVSFRASYGAGGFELSASAPDIHPRRLAHATLEVVEASVRAVAGQLTGTAQAKIADPTGIVGGNLGCRVAGTDVTATGTIESALVEASAQVGGSLTLAPDGSGDVPLHGIPIGIAGVVAGTVDLDWSPTAGPRLSNATIKAQLPWGGEAEVTDIRLAEGKLAGSARIPLPEPQGLVYDGEAVIQATLRDGALTGSLGPLGWTSTAVPGLVGTTHLAYDAAGGLRGRGSATLPVGEGTLSLTFEALSWEAGKGLTGEAAVSAADLALPWLAAGTVSGELRLRLENGALVGTTAKATATLPFGSVGLALEGFDAAGPVLALDVSVARLGDAIDLAAPVVVSGRYEQGATTLSAGPVTFDVALAAGLMTLSGTLGETTLDATGLSSSVLLELHAGPLGLATASATVAGSALERADFIFQTGTFRHPFDSPAIEGSFEGGGFAYVGGRFTGHVAGEAHLVGQKGEDGAPAAGLRFTADAAEDGALSLLVDGGGFDLGLVRVDRFHVEVAGAAVTSDVQLSARDDLPFVLTGGVTASFGDAGLTANGNLVVASKPDSAVKTEGQITVGYAAGAGLTASGTGKIGYDTGDGKLTAKADVSFDYDGQRLLVGGAGSVALDKEALNMHLALPNVLNWFLRKLEPKFAFSAGGFAGVRVAGKLSVGHPDAHAAVKGGSLAMEVPRFDLLGDAPPKAKVNASIDADIGAGVGITPSIELQVFLLFLTAGIRAAGTLGMHVSATSIVASGESTLDPEKGLVGGIELAIPLALTLNPSLALTVTGGVGTWWTFNVAKIAETIAEPVTLAGLAPVTTHLS